MSDTNTRRAEAEAPVLRAARAKGRSARPRRRPAARAARRRQERQRGLFRLRNAEGRLPVSRLAVTILAANLVGLLILLLGSIGLNQYRDGLIAAKLEGVRAQAEVLADVMAAVAAEDAACDLVTGGEAASCDVDLDEAAVSTVFTRVWDGFEGRVRVFETPQGYDGGPIADASALLLEDQVLRADAFAVEELPDIGEAEREGLIERALGRARNLLLEHVLEPGFRDEARRRTLEDELSRAFLSSGAADQPGAASVRYNEEGEIVASVSVPIRRVQAVYGVVTAEIGGIEDLIRQAREDVLPFFALALLASLLSSAFLTAAIARPIRRLASAADKVREGIAVAGRVRIPDFARRKDEIGELATSLRSMTQAIYDRIETIDHFAADVSHELKNPLTSIRSAIETLDVAKTDAQRQRLLGVVKQDVARMDRLITDISNASRLDAELARETREVVDAFKLLRDIVDLYGATAKPGSPSVRLLGRAGTQPLYVFGSPSALGQVFRNLIDNALSFSPQGGVVRVTLGVDRAAEGPVLRVQVADDGPGIPEDNLETVFKRFYTERPAGADFGNNSGLGLAICRQIVESHGGRIWAENRHNAEGTQRIGAMFTVLLPLRRSS
ncbi:HAMP domain-containing histidine kinase [Parvularcula oceani]|uniref:HAMP domain-containing histidine kinase n=1 Tax=Parvularcula oceani TaxID=1247963 RepID=UPI00068F143B|nr:HAMP domain-containing histidine kinase [Parvularcula oceani]